MTKTTPTPRVRTMNLYTVECDGQPVAQAMAISQAEAVRLYVESVQQPTMTARLSSPLEARTLAGLPLLQREPAAVDTRTADLFEATPAADHVEGILTMVEPLAAGGFAPCGRSLGDCGKATQTCGRDGCGAEVVEMPPQPAMHLPRFLALGDEESAAAQPGEPAEPVAQDACAPAGVAPGSSESDAADAPAADAPTQAERMAGAYAAGVEIARQGHTRWSTAFLDADAAALSGLRDAAADAVHAEMLRGFDDGKAQAEPVGTQERRRPPDEAPKGAGKVPVKYRNPATGESWSGRGLRPRWVLLAMDEGKALEDFAV